MPAVFVTCMDNEEVLIELSELKNAAGVVAPNPVVSWTKDNAKMNLVVSEDTLSCEAETIPGQTGVTTVVASCGTWSQAYAITIQSASVASAKSTVTVRPRS